MIWIIVTAIFITLFLIIKYIEGNKEFWKSQNIPCLTLQEFTGFIERYTFRIPFHEHDMKLHSEFKKRGINKLGGSLLFRYPTLYVFDPEIIKNILVRDFEYFVNRRVFKLNDPFFEHMLLSKVNQEWKDLRATISPAFSSGKVRRMFEIIDSTGTKMVNYIKSQLAEITGAQSEKHDCIEIRSICGKFTMNVIAVAAFGIDSQNFENENSPFVLHGKKLQDFVNLSFIVKFVLSLFFPNLMKKFKIRFFDETSLEFLNNNVRDSIRQRKETGEKRNDFLQLMLEAQEENKTELSDDVLIAQCNLFFVGGFDTTETLLMYAAYELALNPEVQEKLHSELTQIVEDKGKFDYESIMGSEYLDMIISETLRKYSPGIRSERMCNKDYPVEGTEWVIKKGTHVAIPTFAMHYDPDIYPEPERFIPERFNSENKAKRHQYAYLPFGLGPRSCIANRFALLEGKVAVSHMVYNFRLSPGSKTNIPIKYSTKGMMKPEGGLWLKLEPRSN